MTYYIIYVYIYCHFWGEVEVCGDENGSFRGCCMFTISTCNVATEKMIGCYLARLKKTLNKNSFLAYYPYEKMKNLEKLNSLNQTTKDVWLDTTKVETLKNLQTEKLPEVISEDWVLTINWLASALWMEKQLVKLPNWKEVMSLVWKSEQLSDVFQIISRSEMKNKLWKHDVVVIDWACPWWLLATITHALHPVNVSVKYPQWGPDAKLPVSGFEMQEQWEWKDIKFEVKEGEDRTEVIFSLENPNIDVEKTINSLVAPEVSHWKPVFISWRWPIAILTALSDAYAHKVPFVACFQPGTWNVVAISHSGTDLWTVL